MGKDTSPWFDLIRLCIRGGVGNNTSAYLAIPLSYPWKDAAAATAASAHQSVSKFAVNGSSQKY